MIGEGKEVELHYELTVEGKKIEDSRANNAPLKYKHGAGQIIKGLEEKLSGLAVGDKKEIKVASEEAYGAVNLEAIVDVPKEKFGEQASQIAVGAEVASQHEDGAQSRGKVTEVKPESIVVDFNHPLAGKDLVFNVQVLNIT